MPRLVWVGGSGYIRPMKQYIPFLKKDPVVAVIRMAGVIASGGRGLNDAAMAAVIERAFARGKPVAVALVINSPGGAPVQTALMAARVRRLAVDRSGPRRIHPPTGPEPSDAPSRIASSGSSAAVACSDGADRRGRSIGQSEDRSSVDTGVATA